MADLTNNKLVQRDGSSQRERIRPLLQPASVQIEERSAAELLNYLYHLAESINYFNSNNQADGNWQSFFNNLVSNRDNLQSDFNGELPPHEALLLCFLRLYQYPQEQLNKLSQKHLSFYYKDILKFQPRKSLADKVHVCFQLADNVPAYKLDAGTLLQAGKDTLGKEIIYATDRDIVINKAFIASLKTQYVKKNKTDNLEALYAAPVANSADGKGEKIEGAGAGWATFGEDQDRKLSSNRTMPEASFGFAIASPALFLQEGNREIHINFSEAGKCAGAKAWLSGEKEWIGPLTLIKEEDNSCIMKLDTDREAVVPNSSLEGAVDSIWPQLKIVLDISQYNAFKNIEIPDIRLSVKVKGLTDLILQNDQTSLTPTKPFAPFGAVPLIGSSFYIGSRELFLKNVNKVDINIQWMGKPDMADYYKNYVAGVTDDSFKVNISYLTNRTWISLGSGASLFSTTVRVSSIPTKASKPVSESEGIYDVHTTEGFIRLELAGPKEPNLTAFGHREYQRVFLNAINPVTGVINKSIVPNLPYTPMIKSLTLNYEASETIRFNINESSSLYHLTPFGYSQLIDERNITPVPLLEEKGSLFMGIKELAPPQNLNLFFQLAEGTSTGEGVLQKQDIGWYYLAKNQWIQFDAKEILLDTLEGFQKSGVVSLAVPATASSNNTILDSGLHWIKAAVAEPEKASFTVEVRTQAVEATYLSSGDDNLHLSQALPPYAIKGLVNRDAAIELVEQPYPSFGGKRAEEESLFYTRVSERLRHKKRGLTIWDIEHLVLVAFPEIFKVKCVAREEITTFNEAMRSNEKEKITLIVIPDVRTKKAINPLQPRSSYKLLKDIEGYLRPYLSPWIELKVENPVYEELRVDCKVALHPQYDEGYYKKQLNEDIKRFLSPWAYNEGVEITFGGSVYSSTVLKFIEDLYYVDFVNDFKIQWLTNRQEPVGISYSSIKNNGIQVFTVGFPVNELIQPANPKAILVSAEEHNLTIMGQNASTCTRINKIGIGSMIIGFNFTVS